MINEQTTGCPKVSMKKFFSIMHNTAYTRGMHEIYRIREGLHGRMCGTCGKDTRYPKGDLKVEIGTTRAKAWPDMIACGTYSCFVVSKRFVEVLQNRSILLFVGGKVEAIAPKNKAKFLDDMPEYYWIDGKKHLAGKMDFESSGFVDVTFCPGCGDRSDNISLTYDRRHAMPPPPIKFSYDEALGLALFTTDLSPVAFFCTELILECAKENKLTNLSFRPTDEGKFAKPMKY